MEQPACFPLVHSRGVGGCGQLLCIDIVVMETIGIVDTPPPSSSSLTMMTLMGSCSRRVPQVPTSK